MQNSKDTKTERNRIKNVFRLSRRIKPYRGRIAGAVVSGVGHQLSLVGVSAVCAYLAGLAMEGRLTGRMTQLTFLLAAAVAARIFFYFMEMWLAHDVAFKVLADFRIMLFSAIEKVSPAILLNMRSGQLASTLMSDVELLEWFFRPLFWKHTGCDCRAPRFF